MPIINLTEQGEIVDLIKNYKKLHDEISVLEISIKEVEDTLKRLNSEREDITSKISKNRNREKEIIESLSKNYGDGKLNLDTFEWMPNKITEPYGNN